MQTEFVTLKHVVRLEMRVTLYICRIREIDPILLALESKAKISSQTKISTRTFKNSKLFAS